MRYTVYCDGEVFGTTEGNKAFKIDGLKPHTEYVLGVSASNGLRDSQTQTISVMTQSPLVTLPESAQNVTCEYYEDALGTEPYGLGTSRYGLGGSPVQTLAVDVSTSTAGTKVAVPIDYEPATVEKHSDGRFYSITGNKTLRFTIS